MNRSLGFFAAALLALSGGAAAAGTPDSVERVRVFDRLVRAAAADDEPAMRAALSRTSRGARAVRSSLAPFASGTYRVILNTTVDRGLGLLAVRKGRRVFAAPIRQERGMWKVEIVPDFVVEAVRPLPEERVVRRTQLAAEVAAPATIDDAAMWFDGRPFDARLYWSPNGKRMSMWGEAPQPLRSGRHVVVAFASTRGRASANAWTFTARGTGSGSR